MLSPGSGRAPQTASRETFMCRERLATLHPEVAPAPAKGGRKFGAFKTP